MFEMLKMQAITNKCLKILKDVKKYYLMLSNQS